MAFILADRITWPWVYGVMAGLMGLGVLVSLWAPEPVRAVHPPDSLKQAVLQPFGEFFSRLGVQRTIAVVLFILLYKLGDNLTAKMAIPFWATRGWAFQIPTLARFVRGWGWWPPSSAPGRRGGPQPARHQPLPVDFWRAAGPEQSGLSDPGDRWQKLPGHGVGINVENFCAG
jgi:PAT family beta-lactamase induction signal transducer AmpG